MYKPLSILVLAIFLLAANSFCQYRKKIDSLCVECQRPMADSEKIKRLDEIAAYYFIYKLNKKADSVLRQELQVAELSGNALLRLTAYFGKAPLFIGSTTSANYETIISFLKEGINYASSQNNTTYVAIGNDHLARIYLSKSENDEALEKAQLAIESVPNLTSDSLKAAFYITLGEAYAANGKYVLAYTHYNNAFGYALTIKSVQLQSQISAGTAEIYNILGMKDDAEKEIRTNLEMDKQAGNYIGINLDYRNLARITDQEIYVDLSIHLSDSLGYPDDILAAKRLHLAYIEVKEHNMQKGIDFLDNDPDLNQSIMNNGVDNYYKYKAQIFLWTNVPDSAVYYFKLAENNFIKDYSDFYVKNFYWELGTAYDSLQQWKNAILFYQKALAISDKTNDINTSFAISQRLGELYGYSGNFKLAYEQSEHTITNLQQLKEMAQTNKVALLGVLREQQKREEEIKMRELDIKQKRNIQYMFITIVICIVFVGILITGSFPVSRFTIQTLGFFFFISVFEFIVMCIDNAFLNTTAHNDPLKLWIIKICLIAALVPVQHFLEHKLIAFLQSKKLLEARTKFSLKQWWKKISKPGINEDDNADDDTAVL